MATKKTAAEKADTPEEPSKALATQSAPGAVALPFEFGDMAGEGMDNMTSADQAVPFIRILQALSPEINKKKPEYVPGAEPGMFIDSVSNELREELIFVPCLTEHLFVEWKPRNAGGGFVGRHDLHSGVDKQCRRNEKGKLVLPNGNELVETFYVAVLLLDEPDAPAPSGFAMLAFTSSSIQPYKKSIGELRKFPGAPLFAHRLRATTEEQSNSEGTWANWVIRPVNQPEGDPVFRNGIVPSIIDPSGPQGPVLEVARTFYMDVRAGQANIAYDSQAGQGTDKGSDDAHF